MQKKYVTKQEPKRAAKIREKEGTEAVEKAKRTLDYAVKDFEIANRLNLLKKQNQSSKNNKKDHADSAYLKTLQTKHLKLNNEIENKQLQYYL